MSNVGQREVTVRRLEVRVPMPGTIRDLNDAVRRATAEFASRRGRPVEYDDDIRYRTDDEHLILWFTVEAAA